MVVLGDVYKGIVVKLKAYWNKVEELFRVKPEASPDQIKIKLSGARALMANKVDQLRTGQGTVRHTKPIAYQEIDGKRVKVECGYVISDCSIQELGSGRHGARIGSEKQRLSNLKSEYIYSFKVAAYDKTKDLIIDPLMVSRCTGVYCGYRGYSLAIDTSENVYVTGSIGSTGLSAMSGAYDTSSNGGQTPGVCLIVVGQNL